MGPQHEPSQLLDGDGEGCCVVDGGGEGCGVVDGDDIICGVAYALPPAVHLLTVFSCINMSIRLR